MMISSTAATMRLRRAEDARADRRLGVDDDLARRSLAGRVAQRAGGFLDLTGGLLHAGEDERPQLLVRLGERLRRGAGQLLRRPGERVHAAADGGEQHDDDDRGAGRRPGS